MAAVQSLLGPGRDHRPRAPRAGKDQTAPRGMGQVRGGDPSGVDRWPDGAGRGRGSGRNGGCAGMDGRENAESQAFVVGCQGAKKCHRRHRRRDQFSPSDIPLLSTLVLVPTPLPTMSYTIAGRAIKVSACVLLRLKPKVHNAE